MSKAQRMMGVAGGTLVVNDTSELYAATMETNQLLRGILEKDAAIYLDKRRVAAVTAPEITKVQNEVNRMRLRAQGIRA